MKGSIEYLKIVSMLIITMFLLVGTGVAYLDDYIVLDTFADGQPSHIMQNHELMYPIQDPFWTCPEDKIIIYTGDDQPAVEHDIDLAYSPPCEIDRPLLTHERIEMWLNPYGQVIKLQYPDKYLLSERQIKYKLHENISPVLNDSNWRAYYIDENNIVVSYHAEQVIPSNKILKALVKYPPGYDDTQAMNDLKLTKREFLDVNNYDKIQAEAYNHSYEAQEIRIQELNEKLDANQKLKNDELAALNETVAQQAGIINQILNWINETFGIDLR